MFLIPPIGLTAQKGVSFPPPSVVGTASETDSTPGSALVHNFGATAQANDSIFIFVSWDATDVIVSSISGYSQVYAQNSGSTERTEVWQAKAAGGETSATINWANTTKPPFVHSIIVRNGGNPTFSNSNYSGGSPHNVSVSRTNGDLTVIHHCMDNSNSGTLLQGPNVGGYTEAGNLDGETGSVDPDFDSGLWYKLQSADGVESTDMQWNTGTGNGSQVVTMNVPSTAPAPPPTQVTLVGSVSQEFTSGTGTVLDISSIDIQSGDLILIIPCASGGSLDVSSVTGNSGSYTKQIDVQYFASSNDNVMDLWTRIADGTETQATANWTNSQTFLGMICLVYRAVATPTYEVPTRVQSSFNTSYNTNNWTDVDANSVTILAFWGNRGGTGSPINISTPPSGATEIENLQGSGSRVDVRCVVYEVQGANAGSISKNVQYNTSDNVHVNWGATLEFT